MYRRLQNTSFCFLSKIDIPRARLLMALSRSELRWAGSASMLRSLELIVWSLSRIGGVLPGRARASVTAQTHKIRPPYSGGNAGSVEVAQQKVNIFCRA